MPDSWTEPIIWLLATAGAAAPVTAAVGLWRPKYVTPTATIMTALAFLCALWGWREGSGTIDFTWAQTWNLRIHFELGGLSILYALMATGVGLAVVVYAGGYIPLHLHHVHRPDSDLGPFYGWLLLFMGAMVGLVTAQDLILLFIFWDLTAITSFFLIGYDRQLRESRAAALMALITTGVTALFLLVAILLIYRETGSFAVETALETEYAGNIARSIGILIALAALAKSAQVPFHFWLPRAMAAPTPVSAYLHSAAMVAAGVFLLGRFEQIIIQSQTVLNFLLVIGFSSMAVGGVIAVTRDRLKQLLAYSTISQYGYVVVLIGLGNEHAAVAAGFYVIAHALAKSALFLTAGTVTEATGTIHLHELGGLWRSMPVLAIASGVAAASLAAFPGTMGFFKDELYFQSTSEHGGLVQIAAVCGAALTVTYAGRFWWGIFGGKLRTPANAVPRRLVMPIVALAIVSIGAGIWLDPFVHLAEDAGEAMIGDEYHPHVGYTLSWTTENAMALIAIGAGLLLLITRRFWIPFISKIVWLGSIVGPERWFIDSLQGLNRLSTAAYRVEVRDFRSRVASVLPSAALILLLALGFSVDQLSLRVGSFETSDLPLILMIAVAAIAALSAMSREDHLTLSLVLSGVGFSLAVIYALLGAPDVALVAVLVETIFTLLFLGMLSVIPDDVDPTTVQLPPGASSPSNLKMPSDHRRRDILIAFIAGISGFVVAWITFSPTPLGDIVADDYIRLTPEAHGKDVVTVILADFRGFDTMGEITVIGIALLGIATLLRRWKATR
ncbi:MAG: hydrogen gas-evolving membrane-bound hydrogenase subunit E [Thermomicrobiales bacterium]